MSFLDGDPIVSCKFCGEEGLTWQKKDDGEWRLYDEEEEIHTCGNGLDHDSIKDDFAEPTDEEWSAGESTA